MKGALLAALLVFAAARSFASPDWFPKAECRAKWAGGTTGMYDFGRDPKVTPGGNFGYGDYAARAGRGSCFKEWSVLVYMNAAADLRPYAFWNLYDMEAGFSEGRVLGGSTVSTDLVVELDDNVVGTTTRYHVFQSATPFKRGLSAADFEKTSERDVQSPVVSRGPESVYGSGPEDRFRSFLTWAVKQFPAKHYVVVIWGHGVGWNADSGSQITPFALASRNNLVMPPFFNMEIAEGLSSRHPFDTSALGRALADASAEIQRPIDVVVSDACLMQTAEVAGEFARSCRFVTGSSQILPYMGVPYRYLMYELNTDYLSRMVPADPDPVHALAVNIPEISQYYFREDESRDWMTMSSVSGPAMRYELTPALEALGGALESYVTENANRAIEIEQDIQATPGFLGSSRDLGLFLSILRRSVIQNERKTGSSSAAGGAVVAAIDRCRRALDDSIVESVYGDRYLDIEKNLGVTGFRGLAVWLPEVNEEYQKRVRDFSGSALFAKGGWSGWLQKVFGAN